MSVPGKVEGGKAVKPETTPAAKKSKRSESPKTASKKKSSSSSKPSAEDLQKLDDKWAERFSRLEAMLVAKSFTVPVKPVVKPAEVTTSQKPFFDPGASTSSLARGSTSTSLVQATGEAVDEMEMATQLLEAPGAGAATQPVQAPGSVPDVQPSGEGDLSAASDSEGNQQSVTGSLSDENYRYGSPDRDLPRDQELSEEASYRETMRGVRSFMGWHKIPEFEQTLMRNQAAGLSRCLTRVQNAMSTQLKSLHLDTKGKSSEKLKKAVGELDYLVTFKRSISQAMARTMQDLSEGVFINMSNFTLARRDSYLEYQHAGVKQDTL